MSTGGIPRFIPVISALGRLSNQNSHEDLATSQRFAGLPDSRIHVRLFAQSCQGHDPME
jgi:hypothetical protein